MKIYYIAGLLSLVSLCEATRTTCLSYDEIVTDSMKDFDIDKYQGRWYVASTNEPTEPGFCKCDMFNWTITSSTEFSDDTTTTCGPVTSTLPIVGTLSTDSSRLGWLQEGSPPVFPLIDNFVAYVESDESGFTASIRYSCKENYNVIVPPFHYKLFESVQLWTREPVVRYVILMSTTYPIYL